MTEQEWRSRVEDMGRSGRELLRNFRTDPEPTWDIPEVDWTPLRLRRNAAGGYEWGRPGEPKITYVKTEAEPTTIAEAFADYPLIRQYLDDHLPFFQQAVREAEYAREEQHADAIWAAMMLISREFFYDEDVEAGWRRMEAWMEARRAADDIEDAWAQEK